MLPENKSFMVRGDDGQEYGPVELNELRAWVEENRAGLGTEVRLDEPGAAWHPWQNYPELVALLAVAEATGAAPGVAGLAVAPIWRRGLAFALDLFLIGLPTLIVCTTLAIVYAPDWYVQAVVSGTEHPFSPLALPVDANIVVNLISDVILALYFTGFHAAHGKTPAKALFRLRVVDQSGNNPTVLKAFLRAFVLIVSMSLLFLPFAYAFMNPQRRTLHDMVADTCVVEA
jgi:uncharacterized RDD family membrane protein YckC